MVLCYIIKVFSYEIIYFVRFTRIKKKVTIIKHIDQIFIISIDNHESMKNRMKTTMILNV